MQHEFLRALAAARHYRSIGLVPLPSRMDGKRPMLGEYRRYQADAVPGVVYTPDEWRTTNIQLMTGAKTSGATRVVVIDLDGAEAADAWKRICRRHDHVPRGAWICETGSGGKHIYYRLPAEATACRTRLVWGLYDPLGGPEHEGGWVKHKAVQLLADGVLAVAPPSKHVTTGAEYRWMGRWSPSNFALPAEAPPWLLELPALTLPVCVRPARGLGEIRPPGAGAMGRAPQGSDVKNGGADRSEVLASLSPAAKLDIAMSWGLRVVRPSAAGWCDCHAVGREDRTPSAGFDPRTGVYHDFGSATKLSFFDLAVALGAYRSWQEALHSLSASPRR